MSLKTFSWNVNAELSEEVKYDVRVIQFGNGVEQRSPKNLKPYLKKWSCSKTAFKNEIAAIAAFFDEHRGVNAFLWQGHRVKVTEYERKALGGKVWQITWKFEEVLL